MRHLIGKAILLAIVLTLLALMAVAVAPYVESLAHAQSSLTVDSACVVFDSGINVCRTVDQQNGNTCYIAFTTDLMSGYARTLQISCLPGNKG